MTLGSALANAERLPPVRDARPQMLASLDLDLSRLPVLARTVGGGRAENDRVGHEIELAPGVS